MRKAEIDHAWVECRNLNRSQLRLDSFKTLLKNGHDEVSITSRLTAFVGSNGAGKTRLLRSLYALFAGHQPNEEISLSIQQAAGFFRGSTFTVDSENAPPRDFAVEYFDISLDVHGMQQYFESQANLEELLTQYEPNVANTAQLGLYRHVCKRPYDRVSVLEIEGPARPMVADVADDEREELLLPFFQVEVSGVQYDNRSMGFGELCASYLIWKTNRMRRGTALLLDEPDSHLSPQSRRALSDALVFLAKERELWIGFTTHSLELLEAMQDREIFLISTDELQSTPRISSAVTRRDAIRVLGLATQRRLLIVVEDVDALEAVWFMINRWGRDIASSIDVQVVSGGANAVVAFIGSFPASARAFRAIAILDGDKREEFGNIPNIHFLPSNRDPIDSAITIIRADCTEFANRLGVDRSELNRSLHMIWHVDHHDFLMRLVEQHDLQAKTVPDVRAALIHAWMAENSISQQACNFVSGPLVEIVNSIP